MQYLMITTKTLALIVTFSIISFYAYSARPLSESDLDNVSAVTGDNILNLFGAPAAGLTSDDNAELTLPGKDDDIEEAKANETAVNEELKSLDEKNDDPSLLPDSDSIDISAYEEAINASKETVGTASTSHASSSEIRYLDKNVHHEMTPLNTNSVKVVRDMFIDRLTIDDLRTNREGDSAGSIYLSDWRSQGSATLVTDD